jgi:hypothetical protein
MHNSTFNLNFYREIFCALQVGEILALLEWIIAEQVLKT